MYFQNYFMSYISFANNKVQKYMDIHQSLKLHILL